MQEFDYSNETSNDLYDVVDGLSYEEAVSAKAAIEKIKEENTEPWLPTIRILRLQHVEYWPTSIKRAARLQTNAVFTAFLLPKHPPFGTSRKVSQKDYLHPTPYRLRW